VSLKWNLTEREGRHLVALEWHEQGGPEVIPPVREGYGSRVIRNALRGSDCEVMLDFNPSGVHCRIWFALPQQQA